MRKMSGTHCLRRLSRTEAASSSGIPQSWQTVHAEYAPLPMTQRAMNPHTSTSSMRSTTAVRSRSLWIQMHARLLHRSSACAGQISRSRTSAGMLSSSSAKTAITRKSAEPPIPQACTSKSCLQKPNTPSASSHMTISETAVRRPSLLR